MLIETRVNADMHKVWDAVWGNDGQGFAYWIGAVRAKDGGDFHAFTNTDADVSKWQTNPQDFRVYDFEEEKWHVVSEYDLAKAWVEVSTNGWTHCGGHGIGEHDACVEDVIMQYAVFGELVYG